MKRDKYLALGIFGIVALVVAAVLLTLAAIVCGW